MAGKQLSRRLFLRVSATAGVGVIGAALLAACGGASQPAAPTAGSSTSSGTSVTPSGSTAAPTTAAATAVPAATAASQSGSNVSIRYTYDDTPGEHLLHDQVKKDYLKLHPEVTLQPEPAISGWDQKTIAELVAGTAPDILLGFGSVFTSFAAKGAFEDLADIIKGWGSAYDLADIYPEALKELQIQGKQFSVPYCFDPTSMFFYLKPELDAAKLSYPDDKWTYDDFQKDVIALTKKDGSGKVTQWGYNGAESIADWGYVRLYPAIWAYGGDKYNADMTKCLLAEPEALQVMEMYYELKTKYNSSPAASDIGKLSYYQMFASGQCAMQTTGPWAISTYQGMIKTDALKDNWDVGAPPSGPKGRFILAGGNDWGLNKNGKSKSQSADLLQYLTGKDVSQEVGTIGRRVPARKSAGNTFAQPNTTPKNQSVFPESLSYARYEQLHPTQEAKISKLLTDAWGQVIIQEKAKPSDIMPGVVKQIDALLAQG